MFARRTSWTNETNRFAQALEGKRRAGGEVLDLTESNPTRCGFQYPPEILEALRDPRALEYAPEPRGLVSARAAVSAYYAERGEAVDPEQLLLTTSTSEGYSWVFRLLCDPGDEVLIPAPSYPLFEYLASIQDVSAVEYPLFYDHGWHVDMHALEQRITPRTRAVLVVNPNNPTGSYLRENECAQMEQLCAAREIALVSDEVFLDFPHDGKQRPSLVRNSNALTFTLSGISKIAGLPQMKVAWIAVSGPEKLTRRALERLEIIADTYLSMNTPVQLALPALLASRGGFQKQVRERVATNLATLDSALKKIGSVTRREADGGWYAVLRVPKTASDEQLAIALLEEQGVVAHPGHFYDFASEGFLVLSLITSLETFREGCERMADFLQSRFG
jgi:alanine-synthesizing transaminase